MLAGDANVFGVALGFIILGVMYALLTLEVAHRTVIALFIAAVVIILNIAFRFSNFHELIKAIDMNTIMLLMCMMMLISVLSRTGAFSYMAAAILSRFYTRPFILVALLSAITAVVSAFVDNVTTVLLIAPIVLETARRLRIDPRPVLLSIVFASNIGGTATLIGDPPNIIIGTMANLGFNAFVYNLTPIVVADFFIFLLVIRLLLRGWLSDYRSKVGVTIESLRSEEIDKSLFIKVILVLSTVIALFGFEDVFDYPPAIPPIIGAGLLLLMARRNVTIDDVLKGVDWSTLVFFMAMFIIIKGIEDLGVMKFIADGMVYIAHSYLVLMMLLVWISAFASAFIDNIPFVMSMMPVLYIISHITGYNMVPFCWALSLGGCLGGNGTLIGASANVVVAGIAERHGHHISFTSFFRYGMPVMVATVGLSSVYLIMRYCI